MLSRKFKPIKHAIILINFVISTCAIHLAKTNKCSMLREYHAKGNETKTKELMVQENGNIAIK